VSVDAVGARIAAIQQQIQQLTGSPAAAAGFDAALTSASSSTGNSSATSSPTAVAASTATTGAGATGTTLGGGSPSAYDGMIQSTASKYGLDPALLKGLIRQESNFNPNAGSPAGAQGLTQLMPATAASLGVTDVHDPAQAIEGGAKYLKQQLDAFGGDVQKALAAYNAGPGAVKKYNGIPPFPETQNYVTKVMGYADEYRGASGAVATAATASAVSPSALAAAMSSPLPTAASATTTTPVAASPSDFGIV
jgi:soluble lytic murein transglycosylase-like protein